MMEHRITLAQPQLSGLYRQQLFALKDFAVLQPGGRGGVVTGIDAQNHRFTAAHGLSPRSLPE